MGDDLDSFPENLGEQCRFRTRVVDRPGDTSVSRWQAHIALRADSKTVQIRDISNRRCNPFRCRRARDAAAKFKFRLPVLRVGLCIYNTATCQHRQRSDYLADDAVRESSVHPIPNLVVLHFVLLMQDWICTCVGNHQPVRELSSAKTAERRAYPCTVASLLRVR